MLCSNRNLREGLQKPAPDRMTQSSESLAFYLSDPLSRHANRLTDFFQRLFALTFKTEAFNNNLPLFGRQCSQDLADP